MVVNLYQVSTMAWSSSNPGRTRIDVSHYILLAFAFVLSINVGGALLATTVIFPVWSASPEAASAWTGLVNEARFFIIVSPIVLLLAVALLLFSGRAPRECRTWIRLSAGLYMVFFLATLIYFVPGQEALQGTAAKELSRDALSHRLQQWIALNWIRQAVGVSALGAALYALGHRTAKRPAA